MANYQESAVSGTTFPLLNPETGEQLGKDASHEEVYVLLYSMYMNLTSLEHAAIAIIVQIIIGLLSGNWWAGAAAGSFFFIGREHAQAEYRWIVAFGDNKRSNMPWYGGFSPKVWTHLDSWLDWLVPIVATVGVAYYFQFGQ